MGAQISQPSPARRKELKEQLPKLTQAAAKAIAEADVFLLASGAGFSADSGLAVYKDIADVPAYQKRGLEYHDICQPHWLEGDPELFYGFWGMCFNDYRATEPHAGYGIVRRWRAERFANTKFARALAAQWQPPEPAAESTDDEADGDQERSVAPEPRPPAVPPTAFFSLTSNVDEHFKKAGLPPGEVREIHGHTEVWQCAEPCTRRCWRAPAAFRFNITSDLLAPAGGPATEGTCTTPADSGARASGFEGTNHPRCIHCGHAARPAILMFGDHQWVDDDEQEAAYTQWEQLVVSMASDDPECKVVLMEVGCGNRVPTIRYMTESFLGKLPAAQATLIRINPDFPEVDNAEDLAKHTVIPLLDTALPAIQRLDALLKKEGLKKQGCAAE